MRCLFNLRGKTLRTPLPEPISDGLIVASVKMHSRDKHHYLRRYLDAFSTSMAPNWRYRCYVDLFAGPGIEDVEGIGLDWGSPLIAAQVPKPFTHLFLNDRDRIKSEALSQRLIAYQQPNPPMILSEDANLAVHSVVSSIPSSDCLTLAFLDPYGLHFAFESVKHLSVRRADLIIFFPDRLDALRNWSAYYMDQDSSNLDSFLGTRIWRDRLSESNSEQHPEILRQIYEQQLRTLGYEFFDYIRIYAQGTRPLYRLIFATKHKMGLTIWQNISTKGRDGQSSFNWGSI